MDAQEGGAFAFCPDKHGYIPVVSDCAYSGGIGQPFNDTDSSSVES